MTSFKGYFLKTDDRQKTTLEKALDINLDSLYYGSFAEIGAGHVVGDGGRHAHARDAEGLVLVALLVELQHRGERLEAADHEQALDLELFDALRQDVEAHRFRVGSWATQKAAADACPPVHVHPAELFDA